MNTEDRGRIRPVLGKRLVVAVALAIVALLLPGAAESAASSSPAFYSGQIASFKPHRKADELVASMKSLGNVAFSRKIRVPEKGWYYRVYIGRYATLQDARRNLNRLCKKKVIGTFLVHRLTDASLSREEKAEKREKNEKPGKQKKAPVIIQGPLASSVPEIPVKDRDRKETTAAFPETVGEKSAEFYYILGIASESKGRHESALQNYTRAIEKDPRNAAAYNKRGTVYLKKGECDLAIADHSRAIALDPKNAEFYFNRGVDYRLAGASDPAVSDFKTSCTSGNEQACEALTRITGKTAYE